MRIRKGGIYKQIDPKDFGIYQRLGFEKIIETTLPKLEDAKVEPVIEDEPIKEVVQDEPIEENIDELPKSKKRKK